MNYSLVKITDAATEPITLADAKTHLRVDGTDEDSYIEGLITAARVAVEKSYGRPLGEQTFELGLRSWPSYLTFPKTPLIAVKSIKYTKSDGTTVTLYDQTASPVVNCSLFTVDNSPEPGELWQKSVEAWPSDELQQGFPIRIRFTAGLTTVPKAQVQAMLLVIGMLYENRDSVEAADKTLETVKWLCNDSFEEFK